MSEVLGLRHSHEAWRALEVSFSSRLKTCELQLKDELQLMQRGFQSIAEFSHTFKGLCDQLAAIGRPIDDTDKVHWYLRALGPNYKIFSTTMMSQLPLPSFAKIVPKALSHEIFESFLKLKKKQSANIAEAFSACSIQDLNEFEWFPDSGANVPYDNQNGIAERKHRHVTETGLTLMFHALVLLSLWVEAFSTAVFLINRLPSSLLDGKTPYELFFASDSTFPPSVFFVPRVSTSSHPMITRGKVGIFKPWLYHAMNVLSSSQTFQALLALKEPWGFKSATKHPEWLSAMDDEIQALKTNDMWVLVRHLNNHNVVGCHWIFKTKLQSDGSIKHHKARLVAQGFSQIHGLNFGDTFSPVVRPATVKIILSLVVLLDGVYIS
ncbi:putative mitochondrial protein [Vitis vinifera]|uniref:Putative mitochondrial protein n=1 Tax=Vitis vinifera TaxID=29760 RepID=A0A438C6J8_VITVI|nr:putative mitochondrial protein [Vitis vinifera]